MEKETYNIDGMSDEKEKKEIVDKNINKLEGRKKHLVNRLELIERTKERDIDGKVVEELTALKDETEKDIEDIDDKIKDWQTGRGMVSR